MAGKDHAVSKMKNRGPEFHSLPLTTVEEECRLREAKIVAVSVLTRQ